MMIKSDLIDSMITPKRKANNPKNSIDNKKQPESIYLRKA